MAYNLESVDWFEWNGVKCTDYGMHVLTQPQIIRAPERVERIPIPGRSGALTFLEDEDIYEQINLAVSCVIDSPYSKAFGNTDNITAICGWLRGHGDIRFANRIEGHYRGRVANQIGFDKIVRGNPHMAFQVQFVCDPFLFLESGSIAQEIKTSPGTMRNLGNIPAQPLLKLTGTGPGSIMCGSSTMLIVGQAFTGVNYIMLDCEAKVPYVGERGNPLDPLRLLGTRVTGEWLTIPKDTSFLTFTGGITSVTVIPRWRVL